MFNLIKLNLNVVQCYMIIPNDSLGGKFLRFYETHARTIE